MTDRLLVARERRDLVLCDGDLPSAVACAVAAAERGTRGPWPDASRAPVAVMPLVGAGRAEDAAARIADSYGLPLLEGLRADLPPGGGTEERESLMLLRAGFVARRLGFERVVWPVHTPGTTLDLERVAATLDRALLAGRLASVAAPREGMVEVEAPYADLGDRALAELALDLDAPLNLCWWWAAAPGSEPGAAVRARWMEALAAVGWRPEVEAPPSRVRSEP